MLIAVLNHFGWKGEKCPWRKAIYLFLFYNCRFMNKCTSYKLLCVSKQVFVFISISLALLIACRGSGGAINPNIEPLSDPTHKPIVEVDLLPAPSEDEATPKTPRITTTEAPPSIVPDQPTRTVLPTVTIEPTRVPGQIGPDKFPENVNPLTGEVVEDPSILNRRPLAIKVANAERVRPQAGLNQADLVFEHYSEGGITRFTAIFYGNTPTRVGSVRSGRLIDLEIPLMYDAAFAYSGSSYQIREMIRESIFFERVISPDFGHGGFWRTFDAQNPSPYNVDSLFTNAVYLRQMLVERGQETRPDLGNGMVFHPDPPEDGIPILGVEVIYTGTGIYWEFQPGSGRFYRWSDGKRHLDANDGQQLNFKNVIVLKANHMNTEIIEDSAGSPSIQIQIWGEGPVTIFRDGYQYEGVWRREYPQETLTFYNLQGEALPLAPGNSFIELVPLDYDGLIPTLVR